MGGEKGQAEVVRRGLGLTQRLGQDSVLLGPAAGVFGVQVGGQRPGGLQVRGQEQLQGGVWPPHAAGGVDARGQPEGDLGRAERRLGIVAGHFL